MQTSQKNIYKGLFKKVFCNAFLAIFFLFLANNSIFAQQNNAGSKPDDEKKKKEEQEKIKEEHRKAFDAMKDMQNSEFQIDKKDQQKLFKNFWRQQNKKFVEHLKKPWVNTPAQTPDEPEDISPEIKPVEAKPDRKNESINIKLDDIERKNTEISPEVTKENLIIKLDVAKTQSTKTIFCIFLDENWEIPTPPAFQKPNNATLSEKLIANYWTSLAEQDYLYFIQKVIKLKTEKNLNDWAFFEFLGKIADGLPYQENEKNVWRWFMLLQAGYQAKIGYQNEKIYLLLPFYQTVFRRTYYNIDNARYYVINSKEGERVSLQIYTGNFPASTQKFDLQIRQTPELQATSTERIFSFLYKNKKQEIKLQYQKSMIELYKNYPLTDLNVFFGAKPSSFIQKSIKDAFEPILKNFSSKKEKLQYLLTFVQKAFEYQTDQQQFGYEKPMFVEETLHYGYIDCEDRSILFSYLVKELLGLEVIGLDYPGHIATAVLLPEDEDIKNADTVEYTKKSYIICDPTYIGANIGEAMPDLKALKIEVILIP